MATEVLEIDEKDIVGYLVDEDDNEVGVLILDEDGNEVELYYDEEAEFEKVEQPADEVVEVEIDEDAILYYLMDKKHREVGLIMLDEDGKEQRLLYAEEDIESSSEPKKAESIASKAAGITKDVTQRATDAVTKSDMQEMFDTFKDVAKQGYEAVADIMDQVDDVRDQVDAVNPKKRRQERKMQKQAERQAELAAQAQAKIAAEKAAAEAAAKAATETAVETAAKAAETAAS